MKACAFFGHRDGLYEDKRQIIKEIVRDLIEKEGVNQFYIGGRGAFDSICADIVHGLKKDFPWIKSTLVLSYIPQKDFVLSNKYDDSVYLLEKAVLPKFAIWETNKNIVFLPFKGLIFFLIYIKMLCGKGECCLFWRVKNALPTI